MASTMTTQEKVQENRVRRVADRQRFALHKSRRRDPLAHDYGAMWLREVDARPLRAATAPDPEDAAWHGPFSTLDEVEKYLATGPKHGRSR